MIFCADYFVDHTFRVREHAAIVVEGGLIRDVSSARPGPGASVVDFGAGVILPGLVNAHTHLELGFAAGKVDPSGGFVNWLRLLMRDARKGDIAAGILESVKIGLAVKPEDMPKVDGTRAKLQVNPALADMLRVLLKAKTDEAEVAQKLIASSADLDALAAGQRDVVALKGWRREVFGNDAIQLCEGRVGLAVKGQKVVTVAL